MLSSVRKYFCKEQFQRHLQLYSVPAVSHLDTQCSSQQRPLITHCKIPYLSGDEGFGQHTCPTYFTQSLNTSSLEADRGYHRKIPCLLLMH
jgi:hypothetical protein